MSPQSPRSPRPASGDDAAPIGRHRRPESLAEVTGPHRLVSVPTPRPATQNRPTQTQPTQTQPTQNRPTPNRRRPAPHGPRHSAVTRPAARRPPVTGSPRAPGTLPIESWLLMGSKRQQILLASLVAA